MVARKQRIPLVLDTNVFARAFKSRSRRTANQQVVRLWLLEKRTQLIVCDELIDEYVGVFEELLGMDQNRRGLAQFAESSQQIVPVPLSVQRF